MHAKSAQIFTNDISRCYFVTFLQFQNFLWESRWKRIRPQIKIKQKLHRMFHIWGWILIKKTLCKKWCYISHIRICLIKYLPHDDLHPLYFIKWFQCIIWCAFSTRWFRVLNTSNSIFYEFWVNSELWEQYFIVEQFQNLMRMTSRETCLFRWLFEPSKHSPHMYNIYYLSTWLVYYA